MQTRLAAPRWLVTQSLRYCVPAKMAKIVALAAAARLQLLDSGRRAVSLRLAHHSADKTLIAWVLLLRVFCRIVVVRNLPWMDEVTHRRLCSETDGVSQAYPLG